MCCKLSDGCNASLAAIVAQRVATSLARAVKNTLVLMTSPMRSPALHALLALSLVACGVADPSANFYADTEADPSASELAVDEIRGVECDGPFNCKHNNPRSDNANRYDNPSTGSDRWSIRDNTEMLDGLGGVRGVVRDGTVMINYGQRKQLRGRTHVYAFAVTLRGGTHASGWVDQASIVGPIDRMPTANARNPGRGDYETDFMITGGDPGEFGTLKVRPNIRVDDNVAATDYLVRPGNVVNLLYNLPGLGGVATDTLPVGAPFRRSLGVLARDLPLYRPSSSAQVRVMRFVYGHVNGRYGWIARDAIAPRPGLTPATPGEGSMPPSEPPMSSEPSMPSEPPAEPPPPSEPSTPATPPPPPPPPPTGQCYVRCCNGHLEGPIATSSAGACAAQFPVCADRGFVRRAEFNGVEASNGTNRCWAKCSGRSAYHQVEGVTSGCRDAAIAFCRAERTRGSFQDAAWQPCQP